MIQSKTCHFLKKQIVEKERKIYATDEQNKSILIISRHIKRLSKIPKPSIKSQNTTFT